MAKCEEEWLCPEGGPIPSVSHGVLAAAWESEETLQCGVSPYGNPCAR